MDNQPTETKYRDALLRLKEHAALNGVTAPTVLLACDGGPSAQVLDYCATMGLPLDWVFRGETANPGSEQKDFKSLLTYALTELRAINAMPSGPERLERCGRLGESDAGPIILESVERANAAVAGDIHTT